MRSIEVILRVSSRSLPDSARPINRSNLPTTKSMACCKSIIEKDLRVSLRVSTASLRLSTTNSRFAGANFCASMLAFSSWKTLLGFFSKRPRAYSVNSKQITRVSNATAFRSLTKGRLTSEGYTNTMMFFVLAKSACSWASERPSINFFFSSPILTWRMNFFSPHQKTTSG